MSQSTLAPPLSSYGTQYKDIHPWSAWLTFSLCSWPCPGTIARNGVKGFKRENGWDVRAGKGDAGAGLVLVKQPPAKGSFVMQLLGPADLTAWDQFYSSILAVPASTQKKNGLAIYYPGFSGLAINNVVISSVSPLEYDRGKLTVEIAMIEWFPPPPQLSIVASVAATAPDQSPSAGANQPPTVDPRVAAGQAELQAVSTNAANTLGRAAGSQ
jgi:hypothetical protein